MDLLKDTFISLIPDLIHVIRVLSVIQVLIRYFFIIVIRF
jgi:hypothetical protein